MILDGVDLSARAFDSREIRVGLLAEMFNTLAAGDVNPEPLQNLYTDLRARDTMIDLDAPGAFEKRCDYATLQAAQHTISAFDALTDRWGLFLQGIPPLADLSGEPVGLWNAQGPLLYQQARTLLDDMRGTQAYTAAAGMLQTVRDETQRLEDVRAVFEGRAAAKIYDAVTQDIVQLSINDMALQQVSAFEAVCAHIEFTLVDMNAKLNNPETAAHITRDDFLKLWNKIQFASLLLTGGAVTSGPVIGARTYASYAKPVMP